ncbi:hypothetical protein HYPP_02381 [Hyphomicrobium sp. ghe19]|nr:hypothetical protein HYPP_02381 [Hyphomicrobium sp. ghe19]
MPILYQKPSRRNGAEFCERIRRYSERQPTLLGYRVAAIHDQHDGSVKISWLTLESCERFVRNYQTAEKEKAPSAAH